LRSSWWYRCDADGADAGEQLVGIEGLGKIVVGSGVEAGDAVVLLHTRGQHDDGKVLSAAQLLEQGEAVKDGQHDVENREIVGYR
jgi:phosphoribosylaminoimidazole (AIR) synthetase